MKKTWKAAWVQAWESRVKACSFTNMFSCGRTLWRTGRDPLHHQGSRHAKGWCRGAHTLPLPNPPAPTGQPCARPTARPLPALPFVDPPALKRLNGAGGGKAGRGEGEWEKEVGGGGREREEMREVFEGQRDRPAVGAEGRAHGWPVGAGGVRRGMAGQGWKGAAENEERKGERRWERRTVSGGGGVQNRRQKNGWRFAY